MYHNARKLITKRSFAGLISLLTNKPSTRNNVLEINEGNVLTLCGKVRPSVTFKLMTLITVITPFVA